MKLRGLITKEFVLEKMVAIDKRAAIHELIEFLKDKKNFSEETARKLESAVLRRENKGSTGIGKKVAIPHAKNSSQLDEVVVALGISPQGIPFDSIDGEPVHLIFMVISPRSGEELHLKLMRKIAYLARDDKTDHFLMTTTNFDSLDEILEEIDERFK